MLAKRVKDERTSSFITCENTRVGTKVKRAQTEEVAGGLADAFHALDFVLQARCDRAGLLLAAIGSLPRQHDLLHARRSTLHA
jgi:hypothetical protein